MLMQRTGSCDLWVFLKGEDLEGEGGGWGVVVFFRIFFVFFRESASSVGVRCLCQYDLVWLISFFPSHLSWGFIVQEENAIIEATRHDRCYLLEAGSEHSALNKTTPLARDRKGEDMKQADIRQQWEGAAPGWARWETTVANWMEPATETMLTMAGVDTGARVLDLACGAGSQTLRAAHRVGPLGQVVANDIAESMLHHVRENARAAGLANVTPLAGAAEDLDVAAQSFDAVICRLGLMLFVAPAQALAAVGALCVPAARSLS